MDENVPLATVKRLVNVALPMNWNPRAYDGCGALPVPAAPLVTVRIESSDDIPFATRPPRIPCASPPRPAAAPATPAPSPPRPPERIQRVFVAKLGVTRTTPIPVALPPSPPSDRPSPPMPPVNVTRKFEEIEVALKSLSLFPRPSTPVTFPPCPPAWPRPPFPPVKVSIVFEWTIAETMTEITEIPVASPPRPPFPLRAEKTPVVFPPYPPRRDRMARFPLASTWATATNKSPFTSPPAPPAPSRTEPDPPVPPTPPVSPVTELNDAVLDVLAAKTSIPMASPASPPRPPLFVAPVPPPAPPRPPVRVEMSLPKMETDGVPATMIPPTPPPLPPRPPGPMDVFAAPFPAFPPRRILIVLKEMSAEGAPFTNTPRAVPPSRPLAPDVAASAPAVPRTPRIVLLKMLAVAPYQTEMPTANAELTCVIVLLETVESWVCFS